MNEKEYLQEYHPNFKAYYPNGIGILDIPKTKEKEHVLQQLKSIDTYVSSNYPVELKGAHYVGKILKKSGDWIDSVEFISAMSDEPMYGDISDFDGKTIDGVIGEIYNIENMYYTTRPIFKRFKDFCGRTHWEHTEDKIDYPRIWINYKVISDNPEEILKRYGWEPSGTLTLDDVNPMTLLIGPRFPKIDRIRHKGTWIENPVLRLGIDCKEDEREKIYAGILSELKSSN